MVAGNSFLSQKQPVVFAGSIGWCNFAIMADFIFPGAFSYDDKGSYVYLYANTEYFQFALMSTLSVPVFVGVTFAPGAGI